MRAVGTLIIEQPLVFINGVLSMASLIFMGAFLTASIIFTWSPNKELFVVLIQLGATIFFLSVAILFFSSHKKASEEEDEQSKT